MPRVERDGIAIHYQERGSGPPLLLGHSFLCSGAMWEPQLAPLSEAHRVVNVDLRGHGESGRVERPFTLYDLVGDMLAVLDHLGVERAIWAGLSIGGMVALRAALEAPERVAALLLLDTHAGREAPSKRLQYRVMALAARVVGLRPMAGGVRRAMFGATTLRANAALVADWTERMVASDERSMHFAMQTLWARDTVVARLDRIRVPALVLVGEEDRALPPAYSEEIHAGLPDSRLVVVPGAGHLATLEQPEAVTRAMLAFLRECRERGLDVG